MNTSSLKIVILGGGFAGAYSAMQLEKLFKNNNNIEITLVNRQNFLLFTPMLHEVAASDLDPSDIINPLNKLLKKTSFFCGNVDKIDLIDKVVTVSHGLHDHFHDLTYDHLVLALGSVTNFYNSKNIEDASISMKSLEDAMGLRSRIIALMEEADFECCESIRRKLLTVVVAGGGFAGVETLSAVNDFMCESLKFYKNLSRDNFKLVLVNAGEFILPELSTSLGKYAGGALEKAGIQIFNKCKVADIKDGIVELSNGEKIESATIVWTAGTCANPLVDALPCEKEKGRIVVNKFLELPDFENVWAAGDCAYVIDPKSGKAHPPTAQHAIREAKTLANNIYAKYEGLEQRPFSFSILGQLASIGRRKGVANILGINFSGFLAWVIWRTIYLMKLPRLEKKVKVAINWTLDLIFTKDIVQYIHVPVKRFTKDG